MFCPPTGTVPKSRKISEFVEPLTEEQDRSQSELHADNRWRAPISEREMLVSQVLVLVLGAGTVALFSHYSYYSYHHEGFDLLTSAIRHWDFRGLPASQPKEFWGYPYLSALVASITRLSDVFAIVLVSSSSFVLAGYLCSQLCGTTVAVWMAVVDWWYIDGAVEGLTEPLFMSLLLGSFLAIRKERWVVAALLASAATVVRPVGIFALLGLAIVLLLKREFRQLTIATAIGLITGIAYVIPMILIWHDPFANVSGYRANDWAGPLPVSIPFFPLIKGAADVVRTWHAVHPRFVWKPFVEQLVIAGWVLFTLIGLAKMSFDKHFRLYSNPYSAEVVFIGAYALFLFSYNAPFFLWGHFPRFVIPLAPFLLLVFRNRLSTDRRIISSVALFNTMLALWPKIPSFHALLSH